MNVLIPIIMLVVVLFFVVIAAMLMGMLRLVVALGIRVVRIA
jgi:hypothetical protein